jgi:hypothetical protein
LILRETDSNHFFAEKLRVSSFFTQALNAATFIASVRERRAHKALCEQGLAGAAVPHYQFWLSIFVCIRVHSWFKLLLPGLQTAEMAKTALAQPVFRCYKHRLRSKGRADN